MTDLQEALKKLFPEHEQSSDPAPAEGEQLWLQEVPLYCKYEKKGRGGKVVTLLEGYTGAEKDFKALAKALKSRLGVGGSIKGDRIIIQGDHRAKVMDMLIEMGFNVKRAGG